VNPRRLYRCRRDRQLAGVAAGMAEYLDVDPTLVRILWIVSVFFGGFTILLYIILAFVMPLEPVAYAGQGGEAGSTASTSGTGADAGADADSPTTKWQAPADWHAATGGHAATGPQAPAWHAAYASDPQAGTESGRGGRAGLVIGVLLVVFGGIALAGVALPGLAVGVLLWPGFLLALGVALLAGSLRRATPER
jgi:phage shock protein C